MNGRNLDRLARIALGAALSLAMTGPAAAVDPTPTPLPSATPTPTQTPRYELGSTTGKVTSVGVAANPGEQGSAIVKLDGSFTFAGDLDLTASSVTVRSVLLEAGGAGELLRGFQGATLLPLTLTRISGNERTAIFATPGSSRPSFRLSLRRKQDGLYLAALKVSRATVPADPTLCTGSPATTALDVALVVEDGRHEPVTVAGSVTWTCDLDNDKLRARSGAEQPGGGGNQAPQASIRTNQITRNTGQPNQVLLDGSGSSDADGTIVGYSFRVTSKPSGAVVFGPVDGSATSTIATLPPGDYTAVLVVTDDQGATSTPATRGFSLH
ncbi:PKD domain-containing protein [Candidatus Binatia bacterium]|nr:PKD domain-containing protein [Candidatus Binatia bacterium]